MFFVSKGQTLDSLILVLNTAKEDTNKILLLSKITGVQISIGSYHEAVQTAEESIKLARKLNNKAGIALAYGKKGVALDYLGDYDKALEFLFKASFRI